MNVQRHAELNLGDITLDQCTSGAEAQYSLLPHSYTNHDNVNAIINILRNNPEMALLSSHDDAVSKSEMRKRNGTVLRVPKIHSKRIKMSST